MILTDLLENESLITHTTECFQSFAIYTPFEILLGEIIVVILKVIEIFDANNQCISVCFM